MNIYKNSFRFGLITGFVAPLIAIGGYLLYNLDIADTFLKYFETPLRQTILFQLSIILCVIPNMVLFFGFYHRKADKSARGVILPTYIFTILAVILKFS